MHHHQLQVKQLATNSNTIKSTTVSRSCCSFIAVIGNHDDAQNVNWKKFKWTQWATDSDITEWQLHDRLVCPNCWKHTGSRDNTGSRGCHIRAAPPARPVLPVASPVCLSASSWLPEAVESGTAHLAHQQDNEHQHWASFCECSTHASHCPCRTVRASWSSTASTPSLSDSQDEMLHSSLKFQRARSTTGCGTSSRSSTTLRFSGCLVMCHRCEQTHH